MSKLGIVVSVYNEEAVIDRFYESFMQLAPQLKWDWELIFVNDGSTDSSEARLRIIAEGNPQVSLINFSRNFGHEAAMTAGIDYADADAVICLDADLQHPIECIPQIIDRFEQGYEVVNMIRTSNESAGPVKRITSSLFYKCINLLADSTKFEENASDFFGISRRVADILKTHYRDRNRFLRGYVQSVGFKKTNIEYSAAARAEGQSHYSIRKLIKLSMSSIIGFSDLPLKLGLYAGAVSGLAGIILLIYTLCTYKGAPSGYATIVVMLCFFFAMMFVVVGIIGQYIAVLFMELKDRPIYIVSDTLNIKSKGPAESDNKKE